MNSSKLCPNANYAMLPECNCYSEKSIGRCCIAERYLKFDPTNDNGTLHPSLAFPYNITTADTTHFTGSRQHKPATIHVWLHATMVIPNSTELYSHAMITIHGYV